MAMRKSPWFWAILVIALAGLGVRVFLSPESFYKDQAGVNLLPLHLSMVFQELLLISWIIKLWLNQQQTEETFVFSYQQQYLPRFFEAATLTLAWLVMLSYSSLMSLILAALAASRYLTLAELVSRAPALRRDPSLVKHWTGLMLGWSLAMLMLSFLIYFLDKDFFLMTPGTLSVLGYTLLLVYGLYQFVRLGNHTIVTAILIYLILALIPMWSIRVHWAVTVWMMCLMLGSLAFIYRYHYRNKDKSE